MSTTERRPRQAEQTPLYSVELERGLLSAVLNMREAIDKVAPILESTDFMQGYGHAEIYEACIDLRQSEVVLDVAVLTERLAAKGHLDRIGDRHSTQMAAGAGYLVDLLVFPATSANVVYAAQRISDLSRLRQLRDQSQRITEAVDAQNLEAIMAALAGTEDILGGKPTDSSAFTRIDVRNLMEKGVPAPTMVHPWFYAGGLHALQSEPGVAKTFLTLHLSLEVMASGLNVVYLDEENGEETITERMLALGADPDLVAERFHYFAFENRAWTAADVVALNQVIATAEPVGMGVLDSLPDFLAAADLDEDKSMDITRFVHRILPSFRDVGAALLVLDHLNKPSGLNSKRQSRYSRGSGAKLGKTHGTILLETAIEFDYETSGRIRIWKTKDRRGRIALPKLSKDPLLLDVEVGAGSLRFKQSDADPTDDDDDLKVARAKPVIVEILKAAAPTEFSQTQLVAAVKKHKKGAEGFATYITRRAADEMARDGEISFRKGPRKASLYSWRTDGQVRPQELGETDDEEFDPMAEEF